MRRARARTGSARSSSRWASPNVGAGPGRDQLRHDRAELRDGVRVRDRRPRDRRGVGDDPARRRRHRCSPAAPRPAIHEPLVGGFASMRALSTRNDDPEAASRPFDTGRDGFVMGEGGGVLVLEELEHAEARGATPLAELVGYGATADASHITLPAPGGIGAVRAARRALEKAGLDARRHRPRQRPRDVDARGRQGRAPGDPDDLRRARAGRSRSPPTSRCSGTRSARPARSRRSSTIQTMREGCVPPTINLDDPDPDAEGLDLTPNTAPRGATSASRCRTRSASAARTRR